MTVEHVVFIVEEPSMEVALQILLPRLLGHVSFSIHAHSCKAELLKRLPDRLRGYARYLPASHRIVVIVDRDQQHCTTLKAQLDGWAHDAKLVTRPRTGGTKFQVVNRLAIEELEAWYFGDWEAVRAAYPRTSATIPSQSKYRNPDAIAGGTWEAFERVLQKAGYFTGGLRKVEAARAVATHMEASRNTSPSFRAFRDVLLEMTQA